MYYAAKILKSQKVSMWLISGGRVTNEVEWTWKAEISRLESQAVGNVCCAWLYSFFQLEKREPLIALGTHQGVLNFCIRSTPLQDLLGKAHDSFIWFVVPSVRKSGCHCKCATQASVTQLTVKCFVLPLHVEDGVLYIIIIKGTWWLNG